MNRFEATWLDQLHRRGDGVSHCRVLVACSGGGDSVALLVFLWAVRCSLQLELIVAHADHGLREGAEADAAFVRELCRRMDLDLVEARLDVCGHAKRMGQGLETAARDLRWAWLRTEAASVQASFIATGHSLDDHTETIFLRLARGGGVGSLTPLPARQDPRWSPLIEVRRETLRGYLCHLGIPWREDPTNLEGFTSRNRLRPLLSALRAEIPTLDLHLWETHAQVAELKELRDRQVESWRGSHWNLVEGKLRLWSGLSETELRWVLERAFRELDLPREAQGLRGLAAWITPRLARKSRKMGQWGGWRLEPSPDGSWDLQVEPEPQAIRVHPKESRANHSG